MQTTVLKIGMLASEKSKGDLSGPKEFDRLLEGLFPQGDPRRQVSYRDREAIEKLGSFSLPAQRHWPTVAGNLRECADENLERIIQELQEEDYESLIRLFYAQGANETYWFDSTFAKRDPGDLALVRLSTCHKPTSAAQAAAGDLVSLPCCEDPNDPDYTGYQPRERPSHPIFDKDDFGPCYIGLVLYTRRPADIKDPEAPRDHKGKVGVFVPFPDEIPASELNPDVTTEIVQTKSGKDRQKTVAKKVKTIDGKELCWAPFLLVSIASVLNQRVFEPTAWKNLRAYLLDVHGDQDFQIALDKLEKMAPLLRGGDTVDELASLAPAPRFI